jgi:adenine-specific DNA-methyltransferase
MGVGITYMGTKRTLAPAVAEVARHAQPGVLFDAFAGMCSVAESIGEARQIWTNDVQVFACEVARAMFTSRDGPPSPLTYGDIHFDEFRKAQLSLSRSFAVSLAIEQELLQATSFCAFQSKLSNLLRALSNETTKCRSRSPHLFATTYSGSYFGIAQAIDADAIYAALNAASENRSISADEQRWGLIALGRSLLKIANSTGHFAQPLKPKPETFRRYLALRRRLLWSEWLESTAIMSPVGNGTWRKRNRAFNKDSLKLIPHFARVGADVSVIYADPPYTDDQYSRFYHVLETLCLYDYPRVTGVGLYRPNRFQTSFSHKAKSAGALSTLIESSAKTGADLILSYPTNGLAVQAGASVRSLLKTHFRRVEVSRSMQHEHSTFGASKGAAKAPATELIYLARST